jgi:hypothetical protein
MEKNKLERKICKEKEKEKEKVVEMGQWVSVEEVREAVEEDLGLALYFPAHGGAHGLVPPEVCSMVCPLHFYVIFILIYLFDYVCSWAAM